ncbi:acyltransferase [Ancylobacter aquaticus]|nr:acyltransferase [Ancylobacter aquaticus]
MTAQSARSGDNLTAIRLLAAVLVMYGHAHPLTGGTPSGYLGSAISTLAVKIFFVISGYLITYSWYRDPNVLRYVQRRALRIFLALIVLCLLTVFVAGPLLTNLTLGEYFGSYRTYEYFDNIVLNPNYSLPGVFADNIYKNAVNGSLWTLPVEFAMYLLVPVVVIGAFGRHFVVIAAIALSVLSVYFTRIHIPDQAPVFWGTNWVNALEMAPYFFWGAAYRLWARPHWFNLQILVPAMVALPLLATDWPTSEVVALLLIPYATLAIGFASPPLFAGADRLGDASYGVYLYGFLVQQAVAHIVPAAGHPMVNFAISLPVTLILGFASWYLIERPALAMKPSKAGRIIKAAY